MRSISLGFLAVAALASATFADWPSDPNVNLFVCGSRNDQVDPLIVPDGAGGALLVWLDSRHYPNDDIYGARVRLDGSLPWPFFGRALADSSIDEGAPTIDADGAGGAVIAYRLGGTTNAFAQRIDSDGTRLWGPRGILVGSDLGTTEPQIVSDGANGAIVVWTTCKYCSDGFLRAQRVSSEGSLLWASGGVTVCAGTTQNDFSIASDGSGGVIVVWLDSRVGLYAQHVTSDGSTSWVANGISLGAGESPHLAADGLGGAFVTYVKNISIDHVFAQHLSALGQLSWGANGVLVYAGAGYIGGGWSRIVPDGTGGAIVGFDNSGESYTVNPSHVYTQRIGVGGQLLWGSPVPICEAPNIQRSTQVIADGEGGAYFVWMDSRAVPGFGPYDIYAQRIDANGQVQWAVDGVAVCTAIESQTSPTACLSGVGGLLVVWDDLRGGGANVYAQHVDPDGNLGLVVSDANGFESPSPLQLQVANPVRQRANLQFHLGARAPVLIRVHDMAGRLCLERNLGSVPAGEHLVDLNMADLPRAVYVLSVRAGVRTAARKLTFLRE